MDGVWRVRRVSPQLGVYRHGERARELYVQISFPSSSTVIDLLRMAISSPKPPFAHHRFLPSLLVGGGCDLPLDQYTPSGVDCTSIPGVADVQCSAGSCAVERCLSGYIVSADGSECEQLMSTSSSFTGQLSAHAGGTISFSGAASCC